ncbi:hypothetical protein [Rhodanobacter denitrificans]|uniref:hypothetical protein n=1 Tax=Rhodanobacter denitrificans TaxID=666685 RepID=UPI001F457D8D|nr:hypothetical protein [Rhodanobacter denitrificans]UJJ58924.1 hypothetical protein LRK55_01950 [Rhodanobacter denitrificans]
MISGDWSTAGLGVAASAGENATPSSQSEKLVVSSLPRKLPGLLCKREVLFMSVPLFTMVRHGKAHAPL